MSLLACPAVRPYSGRTFGNHYRRIFLCISQFPKGEYLEWPWVKPRGSYPPHQVLWFGPGGAAPSGLKGNNYWGGYLPRVSSRGTRDYSRFCPFRAKTPARCHLLIIVQRWYNGSQEIFRKWSGRLVRPLTWERAHGKKAHHDLLEGRKILAR